ncbi:hypothetical protein [Mesomycoplasma ovipneumoniae]|uniref:hypothetical protein n=1 Tax=Mesomycoplasma ovipneumoniae TaxID=29562 RepID=UPI003080BE76
MDWVTPVGAADGPEPDSIFSSSTVNFLPAVYLPSSLSSSLRRAWVSTSVSNSIFLITAAVAIIWSL